MRMRYHSTHHTDKWRQIMDIQDIMKIFDDTAYVRMGGSPDELKAAQYLQTSVPLWVWTQSWSPSPFRWPRFRKPP